MTSHEIPGPSVPRRRTRVHGVAASTIATVVAAALALTATGQIAPPASKPDRQPATQPATPPATQPDTPPTTLPATPAVRPLDTARALAHDVEAAHGLDAWRRVPAVRANIVVRFGGNEMLRGTMLYDPHRGRVRIELADDGPVMVFDGKKAWCHASAEVPPGPRFHLLTWPYFLAAPFKLSDPGTRLTAHRMLGLDGRLCRTARLTFGADVGDTPGDWYVVYAGPERNRLRAMAYIVTYGMATETAEQDPHAIVYDGFREIDGVTLSTRWTFHAWNERDGIHGDPIGDALLTEIEFVKPDDDDFRRPAGAAEAKLPS